MAMSELRRRGFLHRSAAAGVSVLVAPTIGAEETGVGAKQKSLASRGTDPAYPIETRDGVRLFWRSWGQGRPVVFLHGWAVNCDVWQYQMAALSTHVRCITYDKRGHGRSSDPGLGYGYDSLADDLASLLEQLDLRDVVLVGHSMGPAEIVRYLNRHGGERVARLVMISSALPFMLKTPDNPGGIAPPVFVERRKQWQHDMPKFLARNARSFVTADTSSETVAWIAGMGLQCSFKALLEINHTVTETDLRSETARVAQPTLIIHGDQDRSAALDQTGRKIATLIAVNQLKVYEGAPHGLLLTHADRLNSDLADWIHAR
jgi:non-heme chloroperoxidase